MKKYVITGGPNSGKTALLLESVVLLLFAVVKPLCAQPQDATQAQKEARRPLQTFGLFAGIHDRKPHIP